MLALASGVPAFAKDTIAMRMALALMRWLHGLICELVVTGSRNDYSLGTNETEQQHEHSICRR